MQNTSHVAMGNWPTQEDWARAQDLLLAEISKSKEFVGPVKEVGFFEFMICVLFVLEKVGVRSLVNASDVMNCLESLYKTNALFYPSSVFRDAWINKENANEKEMSVAKSFFLHLKDIQMIGFIYGRENVLVLTSSDYTSEETKKRFHCNLSSACSALNSFKDKDKYVSQIFFVAKDLLMAMNKGGVGNTL